jgi:hypothetical protein
VAAAASLKFFLLAAAAVSLKMMALLPQLPPQVPKSAIKAIRTANDAVQPSVAIAKSNCSEVISPS